MPSHEDLTQVWATKIVAAEKYYKDWSDRYHVDALEEYQEGFQWMEGIDAYVINMFYSAIETKTPTLLFTEPIIHITPSPTAINQDPEAAYQYASNNEDLINDWLLDESNNFGNEIAAAIDDSWARFGILEVGYSADWIDNPKVRQPKLASDYRPGVDRHRKSLLKQPARIPENERVYVKNIPAERFRVSTNDGFELSRCDWCGYYDIVRIEDIISNKNFINRSEIRSNLFTSDQETSSERKKIEVLQLSGEEFCKIWKIWDIRAQQRYTFVGENLLIYKKAYNRLPFVDLRFKRRKKARGWYPLSFSFNWKPPQNEINEIRETHRNHRRRFKRILTANKAAFDESQEEIQKMINGPDGTIIMVNRDDAIKAVPNADLGSSANISLKTSFDDFDRIAGTSSEQRGAADRETATAAAISDTRMQVRESKEQNTVALCIQRVGNLVLLAHRDSFVNPIAIFESTPADGDLFEEINPERRIKVIDPLVDLGGEDFKFKVTIAVDTMSPVAGEQEKRRFIEFIALLQQFPMFSMSPTLVRELAFKTGYKNEKVIREFQRMAQLSMISQIEQGKEALGQPAGNLAANTVQQMKPPDMEQIRNQIQGQGVPIQ